MKPDDFLSQAEFEDLSDEGKRAYFERVSRCAFNSDLGLADRTNFLRHYVEVIEWVSPEDAERFRLLIWGALWERSDRVLTTIDELLTRPEISEADKAFFRDRRRDFQAMEEHKRDLDDLDER